MDRRIACNGKVAFTVVVKLNFPLHDRGFHCMMELSIARGRIEALYGRVQKSAATPAGKGRDALPRCRVPLAARRCSSGASASAHRTFHKKGSSYEHDLASHGGTPSPWATHRHRSVTPTSSASCLLERPPPTRAGESETRSPDRRNKAAREQCRRAG